jgi:hypothetical protein
MQSVDSSYGATPQPFDQSYGAPKSSFGRPKRTVNLGTLLLSLFVPWIVFTAILTLKSLGLSYKSPGVVTVVQVVLIILVCLQALYAFSSMRDSSPSQASWNMFLAITSAIALMSGSVLGNSNYLTNVEPYYDEIGMNSYINVNPATYRGNQLMDAGQVVFASGSQLDITKSMSFKNLDRYCVAPVTMGSQTLTNYDFWAVGINCCSGHSPDFHCGDSNNPDAHAGLRLMRDDLRSYYRLAVQQAEAAFNITANHPVFFYWMQDPSGELSAYQTAANAQWFLGTFIALGVQFVLVVVATIGISKLT